MGTAFMFYLMGYDTFEGWVGIDQLDPTNVLAQGLHERYVAPRRGPDDVAQRDPALGYDTARVLVEGISFRAPVLSGPGLKAGLEQIRFMPSGTGGVHTHIACSPYEHGMFRGEWLLDGRLTNGKLEFEGLFEPWE